jgi:hypothetical protein
MMMMMMMMMHVCYGAHCFPWYDDDEEKDDDDDNESIGIMGPTVSPFVVPSSYCWHLEDTTVLCPSQRRGMEVVMMKTHLQSCLCPEECTKIGLHWDGSTSGDCQLPQLQQMAEEANSSIPGIHKSADSAAYQKSSILQD